MLIWVKYCFTCFNQSKHEAEHGPRVHKVPGSIRKVMDLPLNAKLREMQQIGWIVWCGYEVTQSGEGVEKWSWVGYGPKRRPGTCSMR